MRAASTWVWIACPMSPSRAPGRTAAAGLDRNVDTLISKLRRKLGAHDAIRTVRNVGYMFAVG